MKKQTTGSGILSKHRKMAVSITAAVLLVFLYLLIFGFSGQTGEESGGLSRMITEKCVEFVNTLSGKHWSQVFMEELTAYFEHPVRKLAHFTEYACMGVLVYLMWRPWKKRDRRLVFLVLVWVFLSAAGDEFHQRFVPGRYGCFADVILDTCGGGAGVCFCILCEKIWNGGQKKNKTEKSKTEQ